MKISLSWLKEWVDCNLSAAALGERLTMAGLELEGISAAAPAFDGVVVGEVLEVRPHPAAAKLKLCSVAGGSAEPLTIVCGAPNVRSGMRVPLARIGARMPDGRVIERAELRGILSQGMLCSARELGLSEQSEGLMVLTADAPVGQDLRLWLELDDPILELNVTPNRADAMSVLGIAREVAAITTAAQRSPKTEHPVVTGTESIEITIAAPEACPRYLGRVIRNIDTAAETPLWMRERLRRCGLRSLGPVVDVTNYVLLELGQPMHAFDRDKIQNGIGVRLAHPGEALATLDGVVRELTPDTLVIADQERALAIAGIIGGQDSAVGSGTRNIVLESAHFAPQALVGRARRYGLHTESSHRFERGVDPDLPLSAMERATALIVSIAGGEPGPIAECRNDKHLPVAPRIRVRHARVGAVLGIDITQRDISAILRRLGCEVTETELGCVLTPPSFRFDLKIEVDLIEEVGRLYGYSNIPAAHRALKPALSARTETALSARQVRQVLVDRGFFEAITFSFIDPEWERAFAPAHEALRLTNPIATDLAVMRSSLWPGLIQALQHNLNRQQDRVRLFELGLKFMNTAGTLMQQPVIAGAACGPALPEQWGERARPMDFYDLKGDVEALLARAHFSELPEFQGATHAALHPSQCAAIGCHGKTIGMLGALHPGLARQFGISQPVYLFEIDLGALELGSLPHGEAPSRFPSLRRDLAVTVPEDITAAQITQCIENLGVAALRQVRLFDIYRGEKLEPSLKSVALGLILQDLSRTLSDEEVDAIVARVLAALAENVGAKLR